MKKIRSLLVLGLLALTVGTLSSCQSGGEGSKEDSSSQTSTPTKTPIKNDSDLPTTIVPLGEPGVAIHYQRYEGSYKDWGLWLWCDTKNGEEFPFNYADDFGVICYKSLADFGNPKSIGFIVKKLKSVAGDEWIKDGNYDRFLDLDFLQKDENDIYHIYLKSAKKTVYTDAATTKQMDSVKLCEFKNKKEIFLQTNNPIKTPVVYKNGEVFEDYTVSGNSRNYTFALKEEASPTDAYTIDITFEDDLSCKKNVSIRKLYDMPFDMKFRYDGELGALYTAEKTTFRVWSPISSDIKVRLYNNGTPKKVDATKGDDTYTEVKMTKNAEQGYFEATVDGDLQGKYYTYVVTNAYNPNGTEICDPYAHGAGVNGIRGMIVDFARTNPEGWDNVEYSQIDRKHLTVYETTVPDLTSSETWNGTKENAKKFKGVYEKGTTYTKDGKTVKTGFDHIKELGVNAVQFVPFFDHQNDETDVEFNWGYNPLNYNVVEGCYSSNPYDGYVRIRELKEMIKAFKDEGMAFIMDVVYNHVAGLSGSNFDVLMPFYYFRYTNTGSPASGSGCGNDTASERLMFRKFMKDSTAFWTKEYKMDGFRFDLMGLHDIDTMNQLVANVKEINPNSTIYGEPWDISNNLVYPNATAAQPNANRYVGFGQFNDKGRDVILSGGMSTVGSKGWINSEKNPVDTDGLLLMLKGITKGCTNDPDKTVNYATCHDNYTIHDRNIVAGIYDLDKIEKSSILANSLVMLSQGTSFMLSGEELLRTKTVFNKDGTPKVNEDVKDQVVYEVSGNSYASCYKTNEINYELKLAHPELFKQYQKVIALKQTVKDLGLSEAEVNSSTTFKVSSERNGCVVKTTFESDTKKYEAYFGAAALYNFDKDSTDDYLIDTTGKTVYLATQHEGATNNQIRLNSYEVVILESAK